MNVKKAAAVLLAGMMLLPTGVHADDPTSGVSTSAGTIDTTKKGSITLYKFLDNDGASIDATGLPIAGNGSFTSQDIVGTIRQKVGNDSIMAEKGSKFKLLKVADIDQVTENTKGKINTTGTYYTNIDQGFMGIMNDYLPADGKMTASESTRVTDGRSDDKAASEANDHYESDDLNAWILTVNRAAAKADGSASVTGESALNRYIRNHAESDKDTDYCKTFAATDQNGYTMLNNLPLGLYLITEVDWEHKALSKYDDYWEVVDDRQSDSIDNPGITESAGEVGDFTSGNKHAGGSAYADIASPTSPFLISVPMTNLDTINSAKDGKKTAGTAWMYDITVYPKAASINIHKDIVVNNFAQKSNGQTLVDDNDGWDREDTETLCDMRQTNYDVDSTGNQKTALDGAEKGGLTHQIDANIGDTITQVISADVPVLVDDIDNEQGTKANHETKERKHNAKYVITDRMTKGLSLIDKDSFKVTVGPGAWNDYATNQLLVKGTDYTIDLAANLKSYTLTLTQSGLAKLDDLTSASYLYVLYECEVTKDALIGTDTYGNQRAVVKADPTTEEELKNGTASDSLEVQKQETYDSSYTSGETDKGSVTVSHADATNQNTAQLTYATDRTQEHDYYSNTTKVFTYELDLTKLFTDGTQGYVSKTGSEDNRKSFDYSQVIFTVDGSVNKGSLDAIKADNTAGTDGSFEQMLFVRDDAGRYHVYDPWTDSNFSYKSLYTAALDTVDTPEDQRKITKYVTPNDQGLLAIVGLDSRTYRFTEVKTAAGRNLMAEPFYVEIAAPTHTVTGRAGAAQTAKLEDGTVAHAYVYTGSKPAADELDKYDLAQSTQDTKDRLQAGRVPLTVQNNEVIKVLKTGGKGIIVYAAVGAGLIAVAAVLLMKKKREEAEEK